MLKANDNELALCYDNHVTEILNSVQIPEASKLAKYSQWYQLLKLKLVQKLNRCSKIEFLAKVESLLFKAN